LFVFLSISLLPDSSLNFNLLQFNAIDFNNNNYQLTIGDRQLIIRVMKSARDYLIFPLDVATLDDARRYLDILSGRVGVFKIGLELYTKIGPDIIGIVHRRSGGARIFLDLKLHDIPETVRRTMAVIADLGVTFSTVHCGGSKTMLAAAADGAGNRVKILGVTVLTSVGPEDLSAMGYADTYTRNMGRLVLQRATLAKTAGFSGVICSAHEAGLIKKHLGTTFLAVTPGIRPAQDAENFQDQKRVLTPAAAIRNGSDYLVVGRPIRDAKDPAAAADKITAEIASALV
jgi:orotidine-5'-phosphate decarboxylase